MNYNVGDTFKSSKTGLTWIVARVKANEKAPLGLEHCIPVRQPDWLMREYVWQDPTYFVKVKV